MDLDILPVVVAKRVFLRPKNLNFFETLYYTEAGVLLLIIPIEQRQPQFGKKKIIEIRGTKYQIKWDLSK